MLTLLWDAGCTFDPDGDVVCLEVYSEEEEYRVYTYMPVLRMSIMCYKTFETPDEPTWLVKGTGLKGVSYQYKGTFPTDLVREALDTTHTPLEAEVLAYEMSEAFRAWREVHPEVFSLHGSQSHSTNMVWREKLIDTASKVMSLGV